MQQLDTKLTDLVKEALELRFQSSLPSATATPQAVVDSLLDCRIRADRLEGIYIQVVQIRARAARMAAAAKAEADDAWATSIMDMKSRASRNRDQFEGPRERYAEADLASMDFKRKARKAEEVLGLADESSDVIRTAYRGLNEVIQDHRTWLRSLQFQTTLEK